MRLDEVVIIGAGPAGLTAAIQLRRYGIPFTLLEKERVGGLLWNANLVENYPGFPAGVSGPKLIGLIEKQMERIGVKATFDSVLKLEYTENRFRIKTLHAEYNPHYVIVASGTRPNPFPLSVPDAAQKRVFSDVYHLLDQSQKRIIIIGAGDAAFDYALNLTKNRNSVTILNRGGEVQCLRLLWERAMAEPAIEYRAETPVRAVDVDETPPEKSGETGSTLSGTGRLRVQTDAGESLEADYLLFAIGRVPQMDFLSGELVTRNIKGLYFVGDVKNGLYRQATIAAGDGLRAAMEIYFKINSEM